MKVYIGSDHNGVFVKNSLITYLNNQNFEVIDCGSNLEKSDYPEVAFLVGKSICSSDFGILICGTGIGMSIACNKVKGIRCAKVSSVDEAILSRKHNNANVIAIAKDIADINNVINCFLNTEFSNELRHINRIEMIDRYGN